MIKQKQLVTKFDAKFDPNLNKKIEILVTKTRQNNKLEKNDLSYFLGKIFFYDDRSQNMVVYQPTFGTLQLQKDKCTDYNLNWKSKCLYNVTLSA